eukprot:1357369-Amorphochlora_amoeboformis.AAC.1
MEWQRQDTRANRRIAHIAKELVRLNIGVATQKGLHKPKWSSTTQTSRKTNYKQETSSTEEEAPYNMIIHY